MAAAEGGLGRAAAASTAVPAAVHSNGRRRRHRRSTPVVSSGKSAVTAAMVVLLHVRTYTHAPVVATDARRNTPLHLAAMEGHMELMAMLMVPGAPGWARSAATATRRWVWLPFREPPVMAALLAAAASVGAVHRFGDAPLHRVAQLGRPEVLAELLAVAARVHAVNVGGETRRWSWLPPLTHYRPRGRGR